MDTRTRPDQGSATVELTIAAPLLAALILLVVAGGVWMHANHCAQSAAHRAAEAARAFGSTAGIGQTTGEETLTALAGSILTDTTVTVDRTTTEVTVTVSGTVTGIIPGITWPVTATATAPVERFTPEHEAVP